MPAESVRTPFTAEPGKLSLELVNRRRRRVWRQVGLFLLGASAVVLISMTNRDWKSVEECRSNMQALADAVEQSLKMTGTVPPQMPLPNESLRRDQDHYIYNKFYSAALHTRGQAAVCYCEAPHHLYLRANGRHVALIQEQRVSVIWMTEADFRGKAESLGIALTP